MYTPPGPEERHPLIGTDPVAATRVMSVQNRFLAALPAEVLNRLIPSLKVVKLVRGQVLFEARQPVRALYFPSDAVISLCGVTAGGATTELLLVGSEGIVGTSAFMGSDATSRAIVQAPGLACTIRASEVVKEFARHGAFLEMSLRYMQSVLMQTAQSAACNRHHSIDQQLCRWLLLLLDRVPGNRVHITHELIAGMLGVRREGVTSAAINLQRRGVIAYKRGHITIVDRPALERHSCECYLAVVNENSRVLPECAPPAPSSARSRDRLQTVRS